MHTVQVQNASSRSCRVTRLTASCDCTAVHPSSFELPPNGVQEVKLTLNLLRAVPSSSFESDSFESNFAVSLIALYESAGVSGRRELGDVSGKVLQAVLADSRQLDLGRFAFRDRHSVDFIMPLKCHHLVVDVAARSLSAGFIASFQRNGSDPHSCSLLIRPAGVEKAGRIAANFELDVKLQNGESVPPVRLGIQTEAQSPIAVSPAQVELGIIKLNEPTIGRVQLVSRDGEPFRVIDCKSSADCSLSEGAIDRVGAHRVVSCEFTVRPTIAGNFVGNIQISVETAKKELEDLVVPISAHVVDPSAVRTLRLTSD